MLNHWCFSWCFIYLLIYVQLLFIFYLTKCKVFIVHFKVISSLCLIYISFVATEL